MNKDDLIMQLKELEKQYEQQYIGKEREELYPKSWDIMQNAELKIIVLKIAIEAKRIIKELDEDDNLSKFDSISRNHQEEKEEHYYPAEKYQKNINITRKNAIEYFHNNSQK